MAGDLNDADRESIAGSSSSSSGILSSVQSSGQTEGPEEDFRLDDSDVRLMKCIFC